MKKDLTEIVLVLDRSGSMSTTQSDAEGGLKTFMDEQRKVAGECRVTFCRFDHEIDLVFENKPLASVEDAELRLHPRGMTCLLDAMGYAINRVGERLSKTPEAERPGRVIVVTITDGQENSSREFTIRQLFDVIKLQRETYKWDFVFIGADEAAIKMATSQLG